ncbi:MAG: NADH-quinone oxidoreductase subunit C [Chloroflexi bacterium]|nr:NADH-quinone oxidoreductase subunit C [Chloroflexota bacterium]
MVVSDSLRAVFTDPDAIALPADGIPTVRVALADLLPTVEQVRGVLEHSRFVDLTAVDLLSREERFELVYLFYSLDQNTWLRLKTRTDREAPSITPLVPGANWYERELYDLFGIQFSGHPDLRRIMLPDDWRGHPLRRTEPLGAEPVDFTVTRKTYGRD